MKSELKLRGGQVGQIMFHHPVGAMIGAAVLAFPFAFIGREVDGPLVGTVLALAGLITGAPLGATIADSATAAGH